VRSLESFAALVAATSSDAALSVLASELGFACEAVRLDPDTQATLGLPPARHALLQAAAHYARF